MRLLFTALLALTAFTSGAQVPFTSPLFAFSIDTPAGWHRMAAGAAKENLEILDVSKKNLDRLRAMHDMGTPVLLLSKRPPAASPGTIPTIKIVAAAIEPPSAAEFYDYYSGVLEASIKKVFPEMRYLVPLTQKKFGGEDALHGVVKYDVPANGRTYPVRTFFYVFYRQDYFVQFAFTDNDAAEDEEALYKKMISSLRFTKG